MNEKHTQPTPIMIAELKRLRNIVLSCDQQFGDFIRYCMAECEAPEDHVLDVNTWMFVPRPQSQKVTSLSGAKKKSEACE